MEEIGKGPSIRRKVKKNHVHRSNSLPIFDRFDYEMKVEQGILRNYLIEDRKIYVISHRDNNKDKYSLKDRKD